MHLEINNRFSFSYQSLLRLFFSYLINKYAPAASTAIWSNSRSGKNTLKYQCFVLWWKSRIPITPPKPPKQAVVRNNAFSEIRHAPRCARRLSMPIRAKETRFITIRTAITTSSGVLRSRASNTRVISPCVFPYSIIPAMALSTLKRPKSAGCSHTVHILISPVPCWPPSIRNRWRSFETVDDSKLLLTAQPI